MRSLSSRLDATQKKNQRFFIQRLINDFYGVLPLRFIIHIHGKNVVLLRRNCVNGWNRWFRQLHRESPRIKKTGPTTTKGPVERNTKKLNNNNNKFMLKNEGGHIFRDNTRKKISEIKNEFTPLEIQFVINNVNRRSKLKIDKSDFYAMNASWLFVFLVTIQPEFLEPGKVLSNIIISKVKKLIDSES